MQNILVVCVGNICRSPVGERLLASKLPNAHVTSAGIGALVGHAADETATEVALANDLTLEGHTARQFTADIGEENDLILVMEPGHRREIIRKSPHLQGRIMLFDHWTGGAGIPDPYRHPKEYHEKVFTLVDAAATAWADRLNKKSVG